MIWIPYFLHTQLGRTAGSCHCLSILQPRNSAPNLWRHRWILMHQCATQWNEYYFWNRELNHPISIGLTYSLSSLKFEKLWNGSVGSKLRSEIATHHIEFVSNPGAQHQSKSRIVRKRDRWTSRPEIEIREPVPRASELISIYKPRGVKKANISKQTLF